MLRLLLIFLASLLAAQTWPGSYSGAEVKLQLQADLSGTLTFEGQTYPVNARAAGANLDGAFVADGHTFPFTATLQGDALTLTSGGVAYQLRRQGTGASRRFTHSSGYSVGLPTSWTAQEQTEGVLLLPAGANFNPNSPNNPETYIITAREGYDPREESSVVSQLSNAITQSGGAGGQREAARFGNRFGSIYRWDLSNPRTRQPLGFDIYIASEASTAYILVAVGEPGRVRAQDATLRAILGAAAAPQPTLSSSDGSLADNTPLAQRWLAKLRGKRVRQFWASQGMSTDKSHWLNADGTYRFQSSSMVAVDVPGASGSSIGRGDNAGRWRIRDLGGRVVLEVRYNNGNTVQMRIHEEAPNWYLNGEKAFAVDPQ
jgi:hypothetical protein